MPVVYVSLAVILFYTISRPAKKKKHTKLLQPEKFRAVDTFFVPVKKYVISDAAYEYAEKMCQVSQEI